MVILEGLHRFAVAAAAVVVLITALLRAKFVNADLIAIILFRLFMMLAAYWLLVSLESRALRTPIIVTPRRRCCWCGGRVHRTLYDAVVRALETL